MARAHDSPCCPTRGPSTFTHNQSQMLQSLIYPSSKSRANRGSSERQSSAPSGRRISCRKRTPASLSSVWSSSSSMSARSFCCPTERYSPSPSKLNQACTAVRTSPILTPRKEAAPLRYFVHHSRVAAVARAFKRDCNLSMRSSSAGADGLRRFIDRSLQMVRCRAYNRVPTSSPSRIACCRSELNHERFKPERVAITKGSNKQLPLTEVRSKTT